MIYRSACSCSMQATAPQAGRRIDLWMHASLDRPRAHCLVLAVCSHSCTNTPSKGVTASVCAIEAPPLLSSARWTTERSRRATTGPPATTSSSSSSTSSTSSRCFDLFHESLEGLDDRDHTASATCHMPWHTDSHQSSIRFDGDEQQPASTLGLSDASCMPQPPNRPRRSISSEACTSTHMYY